MRAALTAGAVHGAGSKDSGLQACADDGKKLKGGESWKFRTPVAINALQTTLSAGVAPPTLGGPAFNCRIPWPPGKAASKVLIRPIMGPRAPVREDPAGQ